MSKLSADAGTTPARPSECTLALVVPFLPLGHFDIPLDPAPCPGASSWRPPERLGSPPAFGPPSTAVANPYEVRSFGPLRGAISIGPGTGEHLPGRGIARSSNDRSSSAPSIPSIFERQFGPASGPRGCPPSGSRPPEARHTAGASTPGNRPRPSFEGRIDGNSSTFEQTVRKCLVQGCRRATPGGRRTRVRRSSPGSKILRKHDL